MVVVERDSERARMINQIDGLYVQSTQLLVASLGCAERHQADQYLEQSRASADAVQQLQHEYYQRYPNCMSRGVKPWAR